MYEVRGENQDLPLNQYIPPERVTVHFKLQAPLPESVAADEGRLLKHIITQIFQVLVSDDGLQINARCYKDLENIHAVSITRSKAHSKNEFYW